MTKSWFSEWTHYYCALLRFNRYTIKTLFYNKKTKKSFLFHKTTEGIQFRRILYFGDEYMIHAINYEDREVLLDCPLMDEANKQKLLSFDFLDNPYLVKYYFKEDK